MTKFDETKITRGIIDRYYENLTASIVSDALIVGGGPAGLMAAIDLSKRGWKVTVIERNLAPGGGIWGGGMGMNEVIFQEEALPILDEVGLRHVARGEGLYSVQAVELAAGLCVKALHSGATLLNLVTMEDVCVHDGRVVGVVLNRTGISGRYHVDPLTFTAEAVLDGTGHEAILVETMRRRGYFAGSPVEKACEMPMDAASGEEFVVQHAGEVYPGLWVAGMSVCATYGGPRMGPIFGGMLLSGRRVAELIAAQRENRA
jgi:thiazole biosynthesis enzyme